jgi:hypothetical protein
MNMRVLGCSGAPQAGAARGDINDRRARYREMAAADLINFDELRERLAELNVAREDAQRALAATRYRADQLERLKNNRAALICEYAGAASEALSTLSPQERHSVYKMMRLKMSLAPNGDIETIGYVAPVCKDATAYLRG